MFRLDSYEPESYIQTMAGRAVDLVIKGDINPGQLIERARHQRDGGESLSHWTDSEVKQFDEAVQELGIEKGCKVMGIFSTGKCTIKLIIRNGKTTIRYRRF